MPLLRVTQHLPRMHASIFFQVFTKNLIMMHVSIFSSIQCINNHSVVTATTTFSNEFVSEGEQKGPSSDLTFFFFFFFSCPLSQTQFSNKKLVHTTILCTHFSTHFSFSLPTIFHSLFSLAETQTFLLTLI